MTELSKVWEQVKYLLSENISLIPVRDKEEYSEKHSRTFAAKSTWFWTPNQKTPFTEAQLWAAMDYRNTSAVAIVCGEVSGNLEVIDIDVKYKPGIDATLFKAIQNLYPDIYNKLRIHKTPSTGYHLLYKIKNHEVPGGTKLAGRATTAEEKEQDIAKGKKPTTEVNFLETRGEKNYVLAPPSMGYVILKDVPIPTLTWAERSSLISLCKSYTEIIKIAPAIKPTKIQEELYSTNPFEDYNNQVDIVELLQEYDWNFLKQDNQFIWFTRPGKDDGVSASWNKEKLVFFVFTSSTEFEADRGYNAASLLSLLRFKGDKKKTYKYLTDLGFGVFKPYIEEKKVKQTALNSGELPANYSQEAKDKLTDLKKTYAQHLPYGRFWNFVKERYEISREELYHVAHDLGYRLFNKIQIVRIEENLIYQQTDKDFYNDLKKYIWEEDKYVYTQICNAFEAFLQKSGSFTITRLKDIDKKQILSDTHTTAYKYFSNGILEITDKKPRLKPYADFTKLLWHHKIHSRLWTSKVAQSVYKTYLENAIGITTYLKKIIGYLAHDHKSEASAYLIVLTERVVDPKDGGGSGKNIFGNILSGTTTIKTVPGSSIKFDDKFLAPWNNERIYFLADIPKKIDWLFLKEMVTGAGYTNKKYIAETDVPSEDMPKLLLNTNYSYDDVDGGLKRRIRQVEFTDFYTVNGGVDAVHGKMFPLDWTEDDWTGFDQLIVESITELFKAKGKIELVPLSEEGWIKKFQSKHHESTYDFISLYLEKWCETGFVSNGEMTDMYKEYCRTSNINERYRKEANNLSAAVKEYCKHFGVDLVPNVPGRDNMGEVAKGKKFGHYIIDLL